jgi:hypothetical protein
LIIHLIYLMYHLIINNMIKCTILANQHHHLSQSSSTNYSSMNLPQEVLTWMKARL